MAYFNSSAAIPSEPGARQFRSLVMALVTSDSEGSSVEAEASAVAEAAEDDSMSSEAELVPGEWLRACSKCSFQRNILAWRTVGFVYTDGVGAGLLTRDLFDCFKCRAQPIALKVFLNFVDNCC